MGEDNKNKIEDIKRHLYDPNDPAMSHQREGVLHPINHNINGEWQDNKLNQNGDMNHKFKKPPMSPFKKFFFISLVFFIGALGFASYKFFDNNSAVSNDRIEIKVNGNAFTKGGDELPLQIEIINNNSASLEFSNLIIEYPKGAEDSSVDIVRLPRETIGTIKSGETIIRNVTAKLYGEEKSVRTIKVSLEYHPQGSNAIFTKDKYYPVTISLAPLSLDMVAPSTATSNQTISLKLTAKLNTSLAGENPVLQVTYPNNFIFESATPLPMLGNSIWDLSALSIEEPIVFEIKGRLMGQDGEEQVFHAYAGTTNGTNQSEISVMYSSILQKILITKPFLEATILVNGVNQEEYAVSGGNNVDVSVNWSNNLSTRITDGQIIVSLEGNAFNENEVKPSSGFYDSLNNQIIWDKNSSPDLGEINPGESGTVSFSFKPLSFVGFSSGVKDPQVSIKVSIKGREPLLGSTYNDINNFSEKIVKIMSDFQIATSASYTSGSMPPKAETETKYTITWTLSNSVNYINQAQARATLPIYVNWASYTSGGAENLTYNEVTREVIWNIGSVRPNTGIDSNREVWFVLSLKPSRSQVGSVPQLMKEIYLTGTDSFANIQLKSTRGSITTLLSNDPNSKNGGKVVQ